MKFKNKAYAPQLDFKTQTPQMLIGAKKAEALYEKAFLTSDDLKQSDFSKNTTTWD